MKRLYIAATEQHAGKTTVSLGFYHAAQMRGWRTCFMKPVGQRYVVLNGEQVDEDAALFKNALGAAGPIKDLSPVTIPSGFTREYIYHRDPETIRAPIRRSSEALAPDHDLAVIEGTGHAGVGSVLDASNAHVARMLDAMCIIVTGGGIGRCIDEICLNLALFERHQVPVIGAVINKVYEEKYEKVSEAVRQGLANQGVVCLGCVPYVRELTYPDMKHIKEELGYELLCGEQYLGNDVRSIVVAAMEPQNMIAYLEQGSLVVVPGDRVDNILASVSAHLMKDRGSQVEIAGLLLTGGFAPHPSILNILRAVDVPVLTTDQDTAHAAFNVRSLVPKITARDVDKIELAEHVIQQYVDCDHVFDALGLSRPAGR